MEPTQAKPRRRRRWLIVAFVLLLVSVATWWHARWSSERLVGRWALYDGNPPRLLMTVVYRSDGTGFVERRPEEKFQWCSCFGGLKVVLRDKPVSTLEVLVDVLEAKWNGSFGRSIRAGAPASLRWVNKNEAICTGAGIRTTFTRISE